MEHPNKCLNNEQEKSLIEEWITCMSRDTNVISIYIAGRSLDREIRFLEPTIKIASSNYVSWTG